MKRKNKALLFLIITVLAVLIVGTVTTTYAWFLSRYGRDYTFELDSESPVILKYESDLQFEGGEQDENVLVPAVAKHYGAGIDQEALDPLDVFDVDTVSPAHTGKVQSAAQTVKFTATGAYWTGTGTSVGIFRPELRAYLSSYAASEEITSSTLASKAAGAAAHDLVNQNEIDGVVIFNYLGQSFLYYRGVFYISGAVAGAVDTFDRLALGDEYHWHALTESDKIAIPGSDPTVEVDILSILDGKQYLLVQPNTTFSFTLYVFVAKTDEELDPAINGEDVTIFMTLAVRSA